MPRVLNKRNDRIPQGAIYIGRPSKWGNPYVIGRDGSREDVIRKYEMYFNASYLCHEVSELKGKDLVCWCSPEACHGDVLLKYANGDHNDQDQEGGT